MDKLYTTTEVCKILKVSRSSLYRWIKKGWISVVVLPNGQLRVPSSEVEKLLQALKSAR
jgi:excisionase family DNA binding protein